MSIHFEIDVEIEIDTDNALKYCNIFRYTSKILYLEISE